MLTFAWSASEAGGALSLGDAMSMATDGRSIFQQPAGVVLFAGMSLSSCTVSVCCADEAWTTIEFSLDADPAATWGVASGALKRIGVSFIAQYSLLREDFQISFGGNIHATLDLGQEFTVVVGLSPRNFWEVDLTAENGLPALESMATLLGAGDEVRDGLAAVGLGDITLTSVRLGISRADNSLIFVIMRGSLVLAGTSLDVYLQLPNFGFGAALPEGSTIGLAALISAVLGETGGLPDVVISESSPSSPSRRLAPTRWSSPWPTTRSRPEPIA